MSKPRFHPPSCREYAVVSKCVDDQFLLAPTDRSALVVAQALQLAQERHPDVEILAVMVMGNHLHLVLRVHRASHSSFLQLALSQIATRMNKLLGRRGAFWLRRYDDVALLDDAATLTNIHYTHANPVRAHLVERAVEWPGLSSYEAMTSGRERLDAEWLDEVAWREAGALESERDDFVERASVRLGRPTAWDGLSPDELLVARRAMRANMREEESAMAQDRSRRNTAVPTPASLAKKDPRSRPECPKRAPKRKWASGADELVAAHRTAYGQMLGPYYRASRQFRDTGVMCPFPVGTYPPRIARPFEDL